MNKSVQFGILDEIAIKAKILKQKLAEDPSLFKEIALKTEILEKEAVECLDKLSK